MTKSRIMLWPTILPTSGKWSILARAASEKSTTWHDLGRIQRDGRAGDRATTESGNGTKKEQLQSANHFVEPDNMVDPDPRAGGMQ